MTLTTIFVAVSACAFWGIVATNILIAFCNPRWFAAVLDRTIHRACAAHEALVAAIAAHEAYRARNAAEWAEAPVERGEG